MKATELMIGNKVMINQIVVTVNKIVNGFITTPEEGELSLNHRQISGIPLTEEWLYKLGFVKVKNLKGYEKEEFLTINCRVFLSIVFKNEYSVYIPMESKSDYLAHVNNVRETHQLQNLYFALTGEKLILS